MDALGNTVDFKMFINHHDLNIGAPLSEKGSDGLSGSADVSAR